MFENGKIDNLFFSTHKLETIFFSTETEHTGSTVVMEFLLTVPETEQRRQRWSNVQHRLHRWKDYI